jgi:acetoacetyl-CoA reductase
MDRKIAIVTGGTGGIGSAISRKLSENFQVVACYFKNGDHKQAQEWQRKQKEEGYDVDIVYGDIASFDDCEKLVSLVKERFGQIDLLVNNAGVTCDTTLKKMTPEQWHKVIDANLNSVYNMTRNVLPAMIDAGFGRIISISSINGRKGQLGQCNYAATKAALFGFSKSLAQEVARKGITVNTISPGYIETPMLAAMKEEVLSAIKANIPMARLGRPEEIAAAVDFLASADAGFITGANIDINGGQYM